MAKRHSAPPRVARAPFEASPRRGQSGAVLIVALILLLVLTVLGISSMNTTSLEERMAANTQESFRAFRAAEAGANIAYRDPDAFTLRVDQNGCGGTVENPACTPAPIEIGPDLLADYTSRFNGATPPPPGPRPFSARDFQAAHFDIRSVGSTTDSAGAATDIVAVVRQGAYQIAPKF